MDNKQVGELIRQHRLQKNMTQEELASAIGVTASAIGMFEAGKRRPKDQVAQALSEVFNVPKWSIYFSPEEVREDEDEAELWQIRENFRRNPELRTLFSLQKDATKQELKQMEAFIRAIRASNDYDGDDPA